MALYNYFIIDPTADVLLTFINMSLGAACIIGFTGAGDHNISYAGVTLIWDTSDGNPPDNAVGTGFSALAFLSKTATSFGVKQSYELV